MCIKAQFRSGLLPDRTSSSPSPAFCGRFLLWSPSSPFSFICWPDGWWERGRGRGEGATEEGGQHGSSFADGILERVRAAGSPAAVAAELPLRRIPAFPQVDPVDDTDVRRGQRRGLSDLHVREQLPQSIQLLRRALLGQVLLPAIQGEPPVGALLLNVSSYLILIA